MEARRTTYCAGLPLDRERPLSGEERGRVAAMRRAHGARALARLALVPAAIIPAFLASLGAELATGPFTHVLAAAAIVLFGLVLPIAALLYFKTAVVSWLALGRDARGGTALRFAGDGRSVTVLPHSHRVIEWDDTPAASDQRLVVGEAAAVPASAATYAVDVQTAGAAPGLDVVRRPLTPAERDEIASHARRLGQLPAVLSVFSTAFVFLAWQTLAGGEAALPGAVPLVLVWAALLAYSWSRYLRARTLSKRLHADESNGWALRATAGEPAGSEVLPLSGAAWTVMGAPAPWRTGRGSKRGG